MTCRRLVRAVAHPPRAARVEGARTWAGSAREWIRPDRPRPVRWRIGNVRRNERYSRCRPSLCGHSASNTASRTGQCRATSSIARSCREAQDGSLPSRRAAVCSARWLADCPAACQDGWQRHATVRSSGVESGPVLPIAARPTSSPGTRGSTSREPTARYSAERMRCDSDGYTRR